MEYDYYGAWYLDLGDIVVHTPLDYHSLFRWTYRSYNYSRVQALLSACTATYLDMDLLLLLLVTFGAASHFHPVRAAELGCRPIGRQ